MAVELTNWLKSAYYCNDNLEFIDAIWTKDWSVNWATYTASWKVNWWYEFDWTNDYVDISRAVAYNEWTINLRVKHNTLKNSSSLFGRDDWLIVNSEAGWSMVATVWNGSWGTFLTWANWTFSTWTWEMVTFCWDWTNVYIYVDNVLIDSDSETNDLDLNQIFIWAEVKTPAANYLDWSMDIFLLYDRMINSDERAALLNSWDWLEPTIGWWTNIFNRVVKAKLWIQF